jgi:hypothetical protein
MNERAERVLVGTFNGVPVFGVPFFHSRGREMTDDELQLLRLKLKQGNYDGFDIMAAWLAIDELRRLRAWCEKAFQAHPNLDIEIEALGNGPADG